MKVLLQPIQLLLLLLVAGAKWTQAHAVARRSAVVNDRCQNALPFTLDTIVSIDLTDATTDGEVDLANEYCVKGTNPGLWYKFNSTGGRYNVRSYVDCGSVSVAVFKGGCDTVNVTNPGTTEQINTCIFGGDVCSLKEGCYFDTEPNTQHLVLVQSLAPAKRANFAIFDVLFVPNNRCDNASAISIGSPVYANFTFAISVDLYGGCYSYIKLGLWYTFVGTGERLVGRLGQICNNSNAVSSITMTIFTGNCGDRVLNVSDVSSRLCDSQRFFFDTELGTAYYVLIESEEYDMIVDFSIFVPPETNDFCSSASSISIGSTEYANFTYASLDRSEVYTDCINDESVFGLYYVAGPPIYKGLWYTVVGTGERLIGQLGQLCDDDRYVSQNTYMSIYSGDCGKETLRCVKGSNDLCAYEPLYFETIRGRTYHVLVQSIADENILADITISATSQRCGLIGLGLFCPLTWYGLLGRLLRRIFDF